MQPPATISPLDAFRIHFPFVHWLVDEPVLCYPFKNAQWLEQAAEKARRLIISKRLPLIVETDDYWFGKGYRPALIVKEAPDEYDIKDEVPGEECADGGWWDQPKERE